MNVINAKPPNNDQQHPVRNRHHTVVAHYERAALVVEDGFQPDKQLRKTVILDRKRIF